MDPMAMARAHPSLETYSYKSAAGLERHLVEYLLMQNQHLAGEETDPGNKELCLARPLDYGIPTLSETCELAKQSRWDSNELVQARTPESPSERDSFVWKIKDLELKVLNFGGKVQGRMGVKRKGPSGLTRSFGK